MSLQTVAEPLTWPSGTIRRSKRAVRRWARDARVLAPFLVVATETLILALTIVMVERGARPAGDRGPDYWETTSISSTSNVSAAPPGITGGEPLSP
jgi:hypothetical protein